MTVAELLQRISSKELTEWLAFYRTEPFGDVRADLRSAIIACVMANAWRGKNTKVFTVEDFMPKFKSERKKQQTPEEMANILRGIAECFKED